MDWLPLTSVLIAALGLILRWRMQTKREANRARERFRSACEAFIAAANTAWVSAENYLPLTRVNRLNAPIRLRLMERTGILEDLRATREALTLARAQMESTGSAEAISAADGVLEELFHASEAARETRWSRRKRKKALERFKTAREAFELTAKRDLARPDRWWRRSRLSFNVAAIRDPARA